jgi:hypothetical protein
VVDVIGAGFGRTGTASLKRALEVLGFEPCHHMSEVLQHPDTATDWVAALGGDRAALGKALVGYRATQDFPSCLLWREMMDIYPDAKVLLSVRDAKKWYDSARATILNPANRDRLADATLSDGRMWTDVLGPLSEAMATKGFRRDASEEELIAFFEAHNQSVRDGVAPDRLLEYQVGQGWEPLCAFLGVDVPDEPFPHVNDSANFAENVERLITTGEVGFN